MSAIALDRTSLAAIGHEVARALVSVTETRAGCFINTPLLYPSGGTVVVRIEGSGGQFLVSDYGAGHQEAMMLDASNSYARIGHAIASKVGVRFDSRTFFIAEASRDDLVGVVMVVANCSQRAVIETIMHHEARKADLDRAALVDRLDSVFGPKRVDKDIEIRGSSSILWPVTARVQGHSTGIVFDYAKPHHASVTNVAAKFHDIGRLESAPRRIVTVRSKERMGPFVGLLSQAASVVEITTVPDDAIRRLAA